MDVVGVLVEGAKRLPAGAVVAAGVLPPPKRLPPALFVACCCPAFPNIELPNGGAFVRALLPDACVLLLPKRDAPAAAAFDDPLLLPALPKMELITCNNPRL